MKWIWLALILPFASSAQHAVIRGVAPLAIGQEIQLRVFEDPISQKEHVLARQIIEADGSFELKAFPNGVQYAFLQVGRNCADLFIERGKDLDISFVPPSVSGEPEVFHQRHFFVPKIIGGSGRKLNIEIIAFNDSLDVFLEGLYPVLVQRQNPKTVIARLSEFEKKIAVDFPDADSFSESYIRYSIAGVEQTALKDRERLYEKYLKDARPEFNNPAYMDFAIPFFQDAVRQIALLDHPVAFKRALDGREAFAILEQLLYKAEPGLRSTALGRMVLIEGMDRLFGQKGFESKKLIRALRHFGRFSSNAYLAHAANNIADKNERFLKGSKAPEIVFRTLDGIEKRLSHFHGRYVFLEFTDALNPYAQRETNMIRTLRNEFEYIQFVTLCIGNTREEMRHVFSKMQINWEFGGVSANDPMVEDYAVKSLPQFYIIDPKGRFYKAPAKGPSQGGRSELLALHELLKAEERKRVGK